MSGSESEPQRITFYQIPPSVMAYKWRGESVGVIQRRSLDSAGNEIILSAGRPQEDDWILEACYDGHILYAVSNPWLRKFYEDRPG